MGMCRVVGIEEWEGADAKAELLLLWCMCCRVPQLPSRQPLVQLRSPVLHRSCLRSSSMNGQLRSRAAGLYCAACATVSV